MIAAIYSTLRKFARNSAGRRRFHLSRVCATQSCGTAISPTGGGHCWCAWGSTKQRGNNRPEFPTKTLRNRTARPGSTVQWVGGVNMRLVLLVVGVLLVLAGSVWALQGVGILPGSMMSGQM